MDLEIMQLHKADLGWKPDLCKLSKGHESRPKSCDKPLMLAQTKTKVSLQARTEALASMRAWSEQYASAQDIPDEHIPEVYDLRHINGQDMTTPVRDQ